MFDIFTKRSTITVDCFTMNPAVHKYFPPVPANKAIPNWMKKMPATFEADNGAGIKYPAGTLKRCDGLVSLYKKGIALPLWSDLIIETFETGEWKYQFSAREVLNIVDHPKQQFAGNFQDAIHVKIHSPWMFKEKTGVNFIFVPPIWNNIDKLFTVSTPPGIIEYKHQHSTHINMLLPKKTDRLEFFAEDIMAHIIPLSDKNIKVKTHLISRSEWENMNLTYGYNSSFAGKYKKNIRRGND